jgi:hypothetical protein
MGSSGRETVVYNTLERALSVDQNRAQKFAARDDAEVWRYMLDVSSATDDLDAGAITQEFSAQGNPLRAEVVNGLLVKPQNASLSLLVDPGLLYCIDPDAAPSADDSNYKFVRDAGVLALGSLLMTANAAGSTRIDVVECQRTGAADQVVETDNRDVFNPVTGFFTATPVTKAVAGTLTYRVRAGTAGQGWPGTAQGWLPLAVASVPAATVSNDTITFWDVRPMLNDREWLYNMTRARPGVRRSLINTAVLATSSGVVEAVANGRRLGGRLRRGTPGTDNANSLDLSVVANQEGTGAVFVGAIPWYLYLLTPFGLPRWARYLDVAAGVRVPRSPRGIPIISMVLPDTDGKPSAAIALPVGMGFSAPGPTTTTSGVAIGAGSSALGGGFYGDDASGYMLANTADQAGPIEIIGTHTAGGTSAESADFTLTSGTHMPPNATALFLEFRADLSLSAADSVEQRLYAAALNGNMGTQLLDTVLAASPVTAALAVQNNTLGNVACSAWVNVPSQYPTVTAAFTWLLRMNFFTKAANIGFGTGGCRLRVLGWRF